jgi:large subunit ribosomal protein L30
MTTKAFFIKQTKSKIGRPQSHQACLTGLGIRRMHQVVKVSDTVENLGMIRKVAYMLYIEEVQDAHE